MENFSRSISVDISTFFSGQNRILIYPGFVPLDANLAHYKPKSATPDLDLNLRRVTLSDVERQIHPFDQRKGNNFCRRQKSDFWPLGSCDELFSPGYSWLMMIILCFFLYLFSLTVFFTLTSSSSCPLGISYNSTFLFENLQDQSIWRERS